MEGYQFSQFAIGPAVTASAVIICAIVVHLMRFSRASGALLFMSFAAAAWQMSCALMYLATSERVAREWVTWGAAAIPFMAPALYQLLASILPAATHRKWIARAGWIVASLFGVLTFTSSYFAPGIQHFWWGFYPTLQIVPRVLYPIYFGALLAAAVVEVWRAYPVSRGSERQRIRLFAIAIGIACAGAVDLIPMFGIAAYPFGWAILLVSTAIIAHAIVRHGMVPITPSLAAKEIIGTMRDLLLVSDRDGRIRFANQAACKFLGYALEDLIGRPLEEILIPTGSSEDAALQGWVRDREYIFRTKMGQPIELTLSHSPVTHQGELSGAVIIARDLRERKRYEWEARRAVTLLESTLDSTADGILVIGFDGRVLTWNQRFTDLWGIPPEVMESDEDQGLIGHLVDQLVDPAGFLGSLAALHEHPEVESVHVLQLKDGRRFEQYSIGRYLDDHPLRVWSFRDVTARLSAEEALRLSEERYRLLFEQNAAGVCLTTSAGIVIDCNATFAEMVGYEVSALRNGDLREVFGRVSALDEIRRQLDDSATVRGVEIEMKGRDGERVWALANVSLLGQGDRALVHLTAVDISDRKRAEEQVEFQAYHDALTQLPNRRLFVERLELALLTAKRARGNVGVLFIDLDRFKSINDTMGHSVADALLVEIAKRLKSCVRQTDTVARHGGDEFTIILPDLFQPEDAAQVAEKILERVAEPVITGANPIEISASIGIAVFPHDGTDIDSLLRNADDAMYRAKQAGRNTYQLCTEQMKTRAVERSSMEARLRKAMAEGELALAYQPEVSLNGGGVAGAEAMLRWNDPERGIVEASDFILAAEETRLIVPLAEWTLLNACRQLRQWRDEGLPPLRMSVNIPARQFQQRDLAAVIRRHVDEWGIDPAMLELEIHETTAMRDLTLTAELLALIRDAGVSVAIDDFGSVHSSLGSLRVLPINAVKIDRRLIANVATADADSSIVDAVVAVGRALGLRVVAEGVETREQFEFLKRRGCEEGQGSYFSPPVDPESFKRLLKTSSKHL